jgi:hypothetical protein
MWRSKFSGSQRRDIAQSLGYCMFEVKMGSVPAAHINPGMAKQKHEAFTQTPLPLVVVPAELIIRSA